MPRLRRPLGRLLGRVPGQAALFCLAGRDPRSRTKTLGGEPVLTRLANGRVQLRLARPGRMTRAAEQAFLRALSATANVRLSAAAAGFAHSSFYARARNSPGFAREMRLALGIAWERLDEAMFDAASSDAPAGGDEWRRSALPPLPPLNATQVLQLLHLHRGHGRFGLDPDLLERRPGESEAVYLERLRALTAAEIARAAECAAFWEEFEGAEGDILPGTGARRAGRPGDGRAPQGEAWGTAEGGGGGPEPELIDVALDRVTGWSKADPSKTPHDPRRALFGGWRIGDWKARSGRE